MSEAQAESATNRLPPELLLQYLSKKEEEETKRISKREEEETKRISKREEEQTKRLELQTKTRAGATCCARLVILFILAHLFLL
jgi:hypothetical protein